MSAKKPSQATLLVGLVRGLGVELFHGGDETAYVRIPCGTHLATWPLRSKPARRWIARLYFEQHGSTPGAQAMQDAILTLEGMAFFEGLLHEIHLRVAGHDGAIYLDLADDQWSVARIASDGWAVVADPPVRFRRMRGMLPLPAPVSGGRLDDLRDYVNVADWDWPLLAAWLVAALRPRGPFPVLALHGEQGAAKSTTERVLRALIDPNAAALRSAPRNGRDLAIAANNGWVLAYDNLSVIPDWLSDAFCRIATGGGFSTRELYSDMEEVLIEAQRPLVMNGIAELATRPDLLDRAIPLYLPRLERWIPEEEFFQRFERARPALLGALLDAVATGLRNLGSVQFGGTVRMADFAKWAQAAEPGLGLAQGAFLLAYSGNRSEAVEITLEASSLTEPLRTVAGDGFEGTATELLERLTGLVEEKVAHGDSWPRTPRALGGDLRRLAPVLRRVGIEVEFLRGGVRGRKRHIVVRTATQYSVGSVGTEESSGTSADAADGADGDERACSDSDEELLAWLETASIDDVISYFEERVTR